MRKRLTGPVLLTTAGVVLLAHNFIPAFSLRHSWPAVPIAAGLAMLADRARGTR
jgi:hypothetical protein